jgi:hypothetical protein
MARYNNTPVVSFLVVIIVAPMLENGEPHNADWSGLSLPELGFISCTPCSNLSE